jgi:hypothetical protein
VSHLKASLPFSDHTTDLKTVNWHLAFEKPSKVHVGGSWPTGTACKWKGKAGWNADVLVQMPAVSPEIVEMVMISVFTDDLPTVPIPRERCQRQSILLQEGLLRVRAEGGARDK